MRPLKPSSGRPLNHGKHLNVMLMQGNSMVELKQGFGNDEEVYETGEK